MKQIIKRWWADDSGATAVEYGLMVAGITIGILLSVFTFGEDIAGMFETFTDWIS